MFRILLNLQKTDDREIEEPKMSDKMYFLGEGDITADPESGFIEFSAKGARKPVAQPLPGGSRSGADPVGGLQRIPEETEEQRGGWGNKLDFLFSCISVSVGLGNVWRFPYLCYKNGGGAFLVTYGIAMLFCGIPIFFQEVAIGQYLGAGGMTLVGQLCPILQGVGYATMTIVFFLDTYYCVIIAWTIFYLINTFVRLPHLPWEHCRNDWNTPNCYSPDDNVTKPQHLNGSIHPSTPVEEYFDKRVLGITSGIEEIGGIQWELFGYLMLGWIVVYLIIRKGIHQSGKIIWFTALFPYVVLITLLVRAVTLEGAGTGLLYYVTPRWSELLSPGPWIDGATQIFFAYSIGTGALPALGSYNKFHHNCYKDAIITCFVNTFTSLLAGCVTFSILGHLAQEQGTEVSEVVKSGPGLVFLTYPEVVLKLPGAPAWAAIFFIMLVILGVDSEICIVESFVTGLVDNWPSVLRPHRAKFTIAMCVLMFLLGVPMITNGGIYIFQIMDYYSASGMSILWVCFFQTIGISWFFGTEKFCDAVHQMMGIRPNKFWVLCWKYCAPVVLCAIFISQCIEYRPLTYGNSYHYPRWAEILGICLSASSMIWVPLYALYYLITKSGTFKENLFQGLKPTIKPRAKIPKIDKSAPIAMSESSAGLLPRNNF